MLQMLRAQLNMAGGDFGEMGYCLGMYARAPCGWNPGQGFVFRTWHRAAKTGMEMPTWAQTSRLVLFSTSCAAARGMERLAGRSVIEEDGWLQVSMLYTVHPAMGI